MVETIIVIVIVGVVLVFAGRSFYRTLTGKNDGCGCGTKSCPSASHCQASDLQNKDAKKSS